MEVYNQPILGNARGCDPLAGNTTSINLEYRYVRYRWVYGEGLVQNFACLADVSRAVGPDVFHDANDVVKLRRRSHCLDLT